MNTVPIIFDLVANCESIMDCNLKNDLLDAIDKRDSDKKRDTDDGVKDVGSGNKEITKDDIESYFVFDQVLDAINAFKGIEVHLKKFRDNDDYWGEDERILVEYFPQIGLDLKEMFSRKRSRQAIMAKASVMGLIDNEWTEQKIRLLKDNFCIYGAYKMKTKFFPHISIVKIKAMADKLGLVYKGNRWENESKVFLIENYNKMSKQELARKLKRTESSICAMVSKLNLRHCEN